MTFGSFKSFVMGLQNMAVFPENGMKPARERGRERDKGEINAKSLKWESRITTESELSASVNPGFPKTGLKVPLKSNHSHPKSLCDHSKSTSTYAPACLNSQDSLRLEPCSATTRASYVLISCV